MDFTEYIDLAAERLGGRVLAANDEFFAPKENLLKASAPVWIADKYTDVGKWMDGWETRRRRTPGYDWCIVKLGLPGVDSRRRGGYRVLQREFSGALRTRGVRGGWRSRPRSTRRPRNEVEHAAAEVAACRRRSKSVSAHAIEQGHAPAFQNLSGRRRGAPARSRRSHPGLAGAQPRRRRDRSRRRRARRLGDRFERHVFRLAQQPDPAGPLDRDARRLGNAPAPRARPRLVRRASGRAGKSQPRRSRHILFQGQFPGKLLARSLQRRRATSPIRARLAPFPGRKY